MPFEIVRNDITKMTVDAIVNAANTTLLGGGGVDGCIHRAAGSELLEECKTLGGCKTGDAKITKGYDLPCKYVIHTVGPVWQGGGFGERSQLYSCYKKSLLLAKEYKCETVAFPLISAGAYRFPKDKALKIAVDAVSDFLLENEMTVYLVIFDKDVLAIGEKLFKDIAQFIDDRYVDEAADKLIENSRYTAVPLFSDAKKYQLFVAEDVNDSLPSPIASCAPGVSDELLLNLCNMDESFSQMLLRKISEKGMTDAQCYKKANIDRKLFSKIRSDIHYKPSKNTVIAFAVSLELSLDETENMLKKAGFALSHSSKFDIIIEYFISHGNFNIFEINEALFAFDQCLLGC